MSGGSAPESDRGPAVPFPPPLPFAVGLALGAVLDGLAPLGNMPDPVWLVGFGWLLVLVGVAIDVVGILTFRRARTAVYPNRPARCVVDHGLFARSRNPMYVGMAVWYVGALLVIGSWWALVWLPAVLLVIRTQVIAREERHLLARYPAEYAAYCARVPRWL